MLITPLSRAALLVALAAPACSGGTPSGVVDSSRHDLPAADRLIPPAADLVRPLEARLDSFAVDRSSKLDVGPICPTGRWCSQLYPPSWTPSLPADSAGRFLHDFSYAGYHRGEQPLPTTPPGAVYDAVVSFGADPSGAKDSTAAIQSAIAAASAAKGGVVLLPAGTYRCDGALDVAADKVVLRGAGKDKTKLHFTSSQGMSGKSHITLHGSVTRGSDVLLAQDGKNRSPDVYVSSPSGLKVGDEVSVGWLISPDFVAEHGMTGTWTVFLGQWKPIFRRTVAALDTSVTPARVTLDIPLRYDAKVRDKASLRKETGYLSECGIEQLSLSNAVKWSDAWSQSQVHLLALQEVKDGWVRDVHSTTSPSATGWSPLDPGEYHVQSGGILVVDSKRVTVSGSSMRGAQHRGSGGNGYLFEVSKSNEVLIADSEGRDGRHNLIQNWDFGTTGCVFLRCKSSGSTYATIVLGVPILTPAMCEYHHSLAMANLVDQCQIDDGWQGFNRLTESSGAGHTATQSVYWNTSGSGALISAQFGWGYIIGTGPQIAVTTALQNFFAVGTQPEDFVEGAKAGGTLWPSSLYEHQRARRLGLP